MMPEANIAAVVDVETTGWQPTIDEIIEVGAILFEFDGQSGEIRRILDRYSSLREPRVGIQPRAECVHGISMSMLKGHCIDEDRLNLLLDRASFFIAHNASF